MNNSFGYFNGISEKNRKRCRAFLMIIAFCSEYDLNPWEIIMCYFAQYVKGG